LVILQAAGKESRRSETFEEEKENDIVTHIFILGNSKASRRRDVKAQNILA